MIGSIATPDPQKLAPEPQPQSLTSPVCSCREPVPAFPHVDSTSRRALIGPRSVSRTSRRQGKLRRYADGMAEQQQMKALWPAPPPFYRHFANKNIAQLRQIRKDRANDTAESGEGDESQGIDVLSLPAELRYLIPPAPPADNKWRAFGVANELDAPEQSLEDAGVEQLYPDTDIVKQNPQPYLITLARSMLTTFLALTGILSENPELYDEQVVNLQTLVVNMHSLINQYRPHQARETLILMMEERVEKLRAEVKAIGEAGEKVDGVMRQLKEIGMEAKGGQEVRKNGEAQKSQHETRAEEKRKDSQRAAWSMLQASDLDDDEAT